MTTIGMLEYDNKRKRALELFKIVISNHMMYVKFRVFMASFSVIKSKFRG